jgi:hypothetical protein
MTLRNTSCEFGGLDISCYNRFSSLQMEKSLRRFWAARLRVRDLRK